MEQTQTIANGLKWATSLPTARQPDTNGCQPDRNNVVNGIEHDHRDDGGADTDDNDDEIHSLPRRSHRSRSIASLSQSGRTVMELKDLQTRIRQLEHQITTSGDDDVSKTNGVGGEETHDHDGSIEDNLRNSFDHQNITPHLVEKNWNDFMNKDANQNVEHAIEVLKGEPDYYSPTRKQDRSDKSTNGTIHIAKRTTAPVEVQKTKTELQQTIPDRIRINSPLILNVLNNIDRHVDSSSAVVMLRPFKVLVYHEERIRDAVRRLEHALEDHWQSLEERDGRSVTLEHMRCLLHFMDGHLLPHVNKIRQSSSKKVCFRDLWYIFQPGDDIYMPLKRIKAAVFREAMEATPDTFVHRYNMLWRVTGTGGGRPNISKSQDHEPNTKPNPFTVNCYYIDFDGKFFLPTTHTFVLLPYYGEMNIDQLEFFPTRYMEDGVAHLAEHVARGGDTFKTIARGFKHFYYSGLTTVTHPCGCPMQQEPMHQEVVESEVIVDFSKTLLKHPAWRPRPTTWKRTPRFEDEIVEKVSVRFFSDNGKRKLHHIEHDYIHDDHHVDRELANNFKENELIFSPVPVGWASNPEMVPDKDVALLSGRVFAFVLRTRSFASLWAWALKPIEKQNDSLKNLQLRDNSFKNTIEKVSCSCSTFYRVMPFATALMFEWQLTPLRIAT